MESYNKGSQMLNQDQEEEKLSQFSYETESDVSSSEIKGFLGDENMVNLTRKRSKRTRKLESFITNKKMKMIEPEVEVEVEAEHQHSSASDTTTEEDLAFCLMMLSRDKWKKTKNNKRSYYQEEEEEEIETEESEEDYKMMMIKKGRYKCETCGKVFKSYQALGGHRASHKKNRVCNNVVVVPASAAAEKKSRIHQCPICFRVFASGQALGGHKRSHGIGNNTTTNTSYHHRVVEESVKQRMIDLNLPAPNEDQEEVSVVFQ